MNEVDLVALLTGLAVDDPSDQNDHDGIGHPECFWCGAEELMVFNGQGYLTDHVMTHKANCPWVAARRALAERKPITRTFTGEESLFLLEALAGFYARTADPVEVTAAMRLAEKIEFG